MNKIIYNTCGRYTTIIMSICLYFTYFYLFIFIFIYIYIYIYININLLYIYLYNIIPSLHYPIYTIHSNNFYFFKDENFHCLFVSQLLNEQKALKKI